MSDPIELPAAESDPTPAYAGGALAASHPDVLRLVAARCGIAAAPAASARVLEIGCGEAANLLPIAFRLEGTTCVGLDASAKLLDVAREARDRLGVDNLELVHARLEDVDPATLGTFDYVICHGVLSWVAPDVQAALWRLVTATLDPSGVALVSFNCTPGWAVRDQIRHAILEHTRDAPVEEHLERTRELLSVFARSPAAFTPYAALLAEESRRLLMSPPGYIAHEYLVPSLRSFRYGEILDASASAGLRPLVELGRALPDRRMEEELLDGLRESLDDERQAQELCETMLFRAFRLMTFAHAEAPAEGAEPARLATELHWTGRLTPEQRRLSLDPGMSESFIAAEGENVASADPLLKGALLELGREWPATLSWGALTERLTALLELRRVPAEHAAPARFEAMAKDLLELWRLGYLLARSSPWTAVTASETPRVSPLTRWEAERGGNVTGPFHQTLVLDPLARGLARVMDGSRDAAALMTEARALVERGDVVVRDDEGVALTAEAVDPSLPDLLQHAVTSLAEAGLLER